MNYQPRSQRKLENSNKHKRPFPKIIRNMIEICDIILEVLDARFIEETRNLEIEELIKSKNKKIIYVLNKSDLMNLNGKRKELTEKNIYPFVFVSCKKRRGIKELRSRIKIEIKKSNLNFPRAHVGIIGYPNTGKSSLINILSGRSSARTAPEAGFTKGIQKIRLTSDILLLDTPGIIPESKYSGTKREVIADNTIVGARTFDQVKDPEFIISKLMDKYSKQIEKFYEIEAEGDAEMLIEKLAKKKGFLIKGNEPDIDRTSRLILRDWQLGKIRA
ncbi:MAG: YlqF/YawG family GTPase [Nanoarchaeota archaeon]